MFLERKTILAGALMILAVPALACSPKERPATRALLELFPDSIEVGTDERVVAFCPDNTCIRLRATEPVGDPEGWLLGFLFHFGDYYALSDWRKRVRTPEGIDGYPGQMRACLGQVDRTGCMKRAFREAKITVQFVRYDEGAESVSEQLFVPRDEDSGQTEPHPRDDPPAAPIRSGSAN
jgi:hypothetical protein